MARLPRHGLLSALLLLAGLLVLPWAAPAAAEGPCLGCVNSPAVTPSDDDTFTGVLVVPEAGGTVTTVGGRPGGGSSGGGCGGCYSELVPACGNGASVCLGPNADACLTSGGSPYYVLFFESPGDISGDITGYACLRDGVRPVPVEQITDEVRTYLDELVPSDAQVVVQPSGGALIRIPTLVRAAMSTAPVTEQFFTGSGFATTVTARPVAWTWTFGEGPSRTYAFPGAAYDGVDPSTTGRHVTHTYTTPGPRQVQVTVTWEASYTLAGLGTVSAGQVERPSPPVTVEVRTARSELVRG